MTSVIKFNYNSCAVFRIGNTTLSVVDMYSNVFIMTVLIDLQQQGYKIKYSVHHSSHGRLHSKSPFALCLFHLLSLLFSYPHTDETHWQING